MEKHGEEVAYPAVVVDRLRHRAGVQLGERTPLNGMKQYLPLRISAGVRTRHEKTL